MPATSKAQQALMAVCLHDPKHAKGKCPAMSKEQMRDFAATPRGRLPERKGGRRRAPARGSRAS